MVVSDYWEGRCAKASTSDASWIIIIHAKLANNNNGVMRALVAPGIVNGPGLRTIANSVDIWPSGTFWHLWSLVLKKKGGWVAGQSFNFL